MGTKTVESADCASTNKRHQALPETASECLRYIQELFSAARQTNLN